LLDIGCGYGAFVLEARRRGIDACGIEPAEFEVDFARQRLAAELPEDDPLQVYRLGSGLNLVFAARLFDVVTLWNVLEHLPDYRRLLGEVERVLKPGGRVYVICPNYAAFRKEAHYLVFWPPLLPRPLAKSYLRLLGKNPAFLETSIFYRTNWGVLRALRQNGLAVYDPRIRKILDPSLVTNPGKLYWLSLIKQLRLLWLVRLGLTLTQLNPFKSSVML